MSTRQLNRACHTAAQQAQIHKRVSLHTLRHYSACRIMPNVRMKAGEALAW
jgi:integrase/recombinase XerD